MRTIRRFRVEPSIPEPLLPLRRLATNLHWTWDRELKALFAKLHPDAWERSGHDPVRVLEAITVDEWAALAADPEVVADVAAAQERLEVAVTSERWFQTHVERPAGRNPLGLVAYFSPEFGLSETLPQYSGGLGVLAGDHLKAASDLGVPLVGVGLLYAEGYFRQRLNADGWQEERFPRLDPAGLAISDTGEQVIVELAGEPVRVKVWRVDVGRLPLYLLDTAVAGNSPEGRAVTDRLYGGDVEHRLRQEIVLGIGGVRALRALGHTPTVFHCNEGHAGFNALERIRELVGLGLSFAEAVEQVRAASVFTTHTPVPAGIDRFPPELMYKYFGGWAQSCGVSIDDLMRLGHRPDEPNDPRFNMAVMGLRLADRANGVSRLHGAVSRQMFQGLWPDVPVDEVPIGSVTNGIHAHTWVSAAVDELFRFHVHGVWDGADEESWQGVHGIDDLRLWQARATGRGELVRFVRSRMGSDVLDPNALTIGFARRFATYKRATLLLSQPERLRHLLLDPDRPVQFVFAGKAHPADVPGKEMIQQVEQFARQLDVRHRFVFLPDYDMQVARHMYHGCDVWLNNPRRPQEACGTSGMKAALNGALNCSIRDGWWDEWSDGMNGWDIESADDDPDIGRRDTREVHDLFALLEQEIVPLYYDRDEDDLPQGWIRRIKHSWATLGPKVTASRMVRDYVHELYLPAAAMAAGLAADGYARAKALAAWKAKVVAMWPHVRALSLDVPGEDPDSLAVVLAGVERPLRAVVFLDGLAPEDVAVELVHGPVDAEGEFLGAPDVLTLAHTGWQDGAAVYEGTYEVDIAGPHGAAVRVVPSHLDLASRFELGLVCWA
jgi:starch phosphorylase